MLSRRPTGIIIDPLPAVSPGRTLNQVAVDILSRDEAIVVCSCVLPHGTFLWNLFDQSFAIDR